ncbi:PilZ domain-containing protein [bacterium]|nr:PilZ domain-containing protein [bacterium]
MDNNRRIEYRIMADLIVNDLAFTGNIRKIQGLIRELSASGCRLDSSEDLEIGQELLMDFMLDEKEKIEQVKARVIRRLSQRSRRVVGVEFLELPEKLQYKIREFIVWKESQGESQ